MAEGYSRGSPERKRPAASEADPIKDVSFLTNRAAVYLEMGKALLTEVCEETKVAELKIKFGSFQMHVKRNIETAPTPAPIVSPTSAPPVPTEPMNESAPVDSLPSPAKSSAEKMIMFSSTEIC